MQSMKCWILYTISWRPEHNTTMRHNFLHKIHSSPMRHLKITSNNIASSLNIHTGTSIIMSTEDDIIQIQLMNLLEFRSNQMPSNFTCETPIHTPREILSRILHLIEINPDCGPVLFWYSRAFHIIISKKYIWPKIYWNSSGTFL